VAADLAKQVAASAVDGTAMVGVMLESHINEGKQVCVGVLQAAARVLSHVAAVPRTSRTAPTFSTE